MKLRRELKAAFFIRLEYIANDFEDAFEVGSVSEFETWLGGDDEGWLLLDSVDEARLRHPGDFERAVRKLSSRINSALQRVHIFITGRSSAWRPRTDLDHCIKCLPFHPPKAKPNDVGRESEPNGDEPGFVLNNVVNEKERPAFKILAVDDLNAKQVEKFASATGVQNTKAFLVAIERNDAWSFTARPQDLRELGEFWNDTGRIGSRMEIMQNSIDRRLVERVQNRAEARPLSVQRAREGARLIAAAVTLTRVATIRIPDGADNMKGIDVAELLPDWDDNDKAALLSRPIFDEAIYGTVRFHHRSVREFLTAEWMAELLERETSRTSVEALLFRRQYGRDVAVPTMRPILPWLAIRDNKVLERIKRIEPEIILEGGDPCQLPLETRRSIFRQVCEQICSGNSRGAFNDFASVQRFANEDLVDDVRQLLQKSAGNEDLTSFLLRMVWLGELKEALPEAKEFSLSVASSKYVRIVAIRAMRAVSSLAEMNFIRDRFLEEQDILNRDCLAELIEDVEPTPRSERWLFECIAKADVKRPFSVDRLQEAIEEFVLRARLNEVPAIIAGLNELLERPPVTERRYCEISQRFYWLMGAAIAGTERLIDAKHPAALKADGLSILHRFPMLSQRELHEHDDTKRRFFNLIPAWRELNRQLFWYEARKANDSIDEDSGGAPLIDFWRVSMQPFWRFESTDFEYVLGEISERTLLYEKQLALSLAFNLYVVAGRDRKQQLKLKKAVADKEELRGRLATLLKPPARGRQKWKQQEATWKKRRIDEEKKQLESREKSRKYLRENPDMLRVNALSPGVLSNPQWYVHEFATEMNPKAERWTEEHWRSLSTEFGAEVVQAFRDGATEFWREYIPKLRSEGARSNSTPYAAIFGLTGLQIEATGTTDWPMTLNQNEVYQACRYAIYQLNGFPDWFSGLFEAHRQVVGHFLLQEISFELSIESVDIDSHYILQDISGSGQWAWNTLAPDIIAMLRNREPLNRANVSYLLNILQGSDAADREIAELAAWKCQTLHLGEHEAVWFAVWVGTAPTEAIPALAARFDRINEPCDRTHFAMQFVTQLVGCHGEVSRVRRAFVTPRYLQSLFLLMNQHIRMTDDTNRAGTGGYSPDLRDYAQRARDNLAEQLRNIPGKEAYLALAELSASHPDPGYRSWFSVLAKSRAELDADFGEWSTCDVREFNSAMERTPANHRELAELANFRLMDLKNDIENGDSSIAQILQSARLETDMRKFIGRELREKAHGRYSIPQEEELADAKRTDLRFHGVGFDGPVPCELKLADNWTGPQLFERLENQLCGDYLRDRRSSCGQFLLVYRGEKPSWTIPGSPKRVKFDGLVNALEQHWQSISPNYASVDHIDVIGIDLTKRSA